MRFRIFEHSMKSSEGCTPSDFYICPKDRIFKRNRNHLLVMVRREDAPERLNNT